jgi:hypothetical protein
VRRHVPSGSPQRSDKGRVAKTRARFLDGAARAAPAG